MKALIILSLLFFTTNLHAQFNPANLDKIAESCSKPNCMLDTKVDTKPKVKPTSVKPADLKQGLATHEQKLDGNRHRATEVFKHVPKGKKASSLERLLRFVGGSKLKTAGLVVSGLGSFSLKSQATEDNSNIALSASSEIANQADSSEATSNLN